MTRDESADMTGLREIIASEVWRIHGPESTDRESAEMDGEDIARAILASDWLADHVAAAREADRAEVREVTRRLDAAMLRNIAYQQRLDGLVAKIEVLADAYVAAADRYVNSHLVQRARDLRRHADDLRALLDADAATEDDQ